MPQFLPAVAVEEMPDLEGTMTTLPGKSSSTNVTTTAVLLVAVRVCAANPDRKGFYLWNNSSNSCYINFGSTVASAAPVAIVPSFQAHVHLGPTVWTGEIWAIRNSGSGNVVVTELL